MSNIRDFLISGVMTRKFQLFTSSGTWTRPAAHVGDTVFVTAIGGGGGGSYTNSGAVNACAGNGGVAVQEYPYTVAGNITVTIGGGGAGKTGTIGVGTDGSATSFGSLSVGGGGGGQISSGIMSASGTGGGASSGSMDDVVPSWYSGRFGAPTNVYHPSGTQFLPGGGGLLLGNTKYGYGGYARANNPGENGGAGAVLVEWWETA